MARAPDTPDFEVAAHTYVRLGRAQGWLCIGVATAVVALGWLGNLDWVTGRFLQEWPRTTPWAAILFIAVGAAALVGRSRRRLGRWMFAAVLALTIAFTLLSFAGVDRPWTPFGREVAESGGPAPGLPSLAALVVVAMIAASGILLIDRRAAAVRTTLVTIATLVALANAMVTALGMKQSESAYGFSITTALLSMFAVAAVCAIDEGVAPAAMYRKRPWQTMTRVSIGALICIPIVAFIQSHSSEVPPDAVPVLGGLILLAAAAGGVCWFGWVDFEAQSWKRVAENGTDAVLAFDSHGRIRSANGRCISVTGWTASQLVGKRVEDLIDPDPGSSQKNLAQKFLSDPSACQMLSRPVAVHGADGSQRLVIIRLVPAIGPDGPLVYATLNDASRESDLRHRATHDPLTEVLNRAGITDYLERELGRGESAGVLFIDVDNLKVINDELSHAAGDTALREVASAIEQRLRGRDRVGRLGGDEFACVITEVASHDVLETVANRIADSVGSVTVEGPSGSMNVTVSIGGVLASAATGAEAAINAADEAMYSVKKAGGNETFIAGIAGRSLSGTTSAATVRHSATAADLTEERHKSRM